MAERTNVLFLHSQSGFGADSVIHAHLMKHLDRRHFVVHVACVASDGGETPLSLATLRAIPDIRLRPTHFAPGIRRRTATEVLTSLGASITFPLDFIALRNYVVREQIRIIHATDRPRDSVYGVALARLSGARSIVHVHVKWSNEYSAAAKWAVRRADAAFGISSYVSETIVGMGKPREQVHTVLNCVDPARWDPRTDGSSVRREFGIPDDAPLLASVSRLFSWKGQRELVRAVAEVSRSVPEVRLLVVGADEPHVHGGSFTAELKQLASTLGIEDRVVFTGPRSDIPQIMAACDVFTLASFEEPFGLVFLEAMAMERPVIAVNNGGTPEVVEHGRAGLLSEPWNVAELGTNILRLLRDRPLRERMGKFGRSRVLEYFNAERMAQDAAAAYDRILAGTGRGAS